ncbi:MAG TPA: ABC transporter substrate-binding protein [Burkholderiaceae bacterium]|nr:ABC transporter substrate-binding protein [Burkholderiaceae bacterium]
MFKNLKHLLAAGLLAGTSWLHAAETSPEDMVQKVSTEVIEAVKADKAIQAGDFKKIITLVDEKILPHLNFQRMTSSAVGRYWRQATPEQQKRLQEEFKTLLVRTYAGALTQVKDHNVVMRPMRSKPEDTEVVVRTQIKGSGEPIQLDYRLEKAEGTWQIYDVNVLGVWLVDNYRSSFAQEISAAGIDGLIAKLTERNKAAATAKT